MSEKPTDSTDTVASISSSSSSVSADLLLPYTDRPIAFAPGHWVLARAGKRALRPGGAVLSTAMLSHARLAGADVVELAPGLGRTAAEIIEAGSASYTAIDRNLGVARRVAVVIGDFGAVRQNEVADTGLDETSTDVVVGEAMLTMQGDKGRTAIVVETARVLRPGGRYAIHELGVVPDDIDEDCHTQPRRDLARSIYINARPITAAAWKEFMENTGLVVDWVDTALMALLKVDRSIRDEGLGGLLRIARNVTANKALRRCIQEMTATFKRYEKDVVDIALAAHKPAS